MLIGFCVKSQPHMEHALIKSTSPTTHLSLFQAPGNCYSTLKVMFLQSWHKTESMWYIFVYLVHFSMQNGLQPHLYNFSKDWYLDTGEMAEG